MDRVEEFVNFLEEYTDFLMGLSASRTMLETRKGDAKDIDGRLERYNNSIDYKFVVRELRDDKSRLAPELAGITEQNRIYEQEKKGVVDMGLNALSGLAEILAEAGLDQSQVEQSLAGVMFRINNKLSAAASKEAAPVAKEPEQKQ